MIAAAVSGVAYYLAMPGPGVWPLAFVALAPLLISVGRLPAAAAFRQAWVAGFVAWVLTLRWIVPTVRAANAPALVGILGTAALSAYLALYFGAFGWWWAWLANSGRPGGRPYADNEPGTFQRGTEYAPGLRAALAACGWVALEAVRARLFTGFPWTPLSLALWAHPILIQPAGWVGAYGISWMLAFVNGGLAIWWDARRRGAWAWPVGVVAGAVVMSAVVLARTAGGQEAAPTQTDGRGQAPPVRVALLQGNIPQYVKWDARFVAHIRSEYARLARAAAASGASLIIWPESALTGFLDSPAEHDWLTGVVHRTGAWHLVGAPARSPAAGKLLNRAALVRPDGTLAGAYDKVHLVPFGETVPLQSVLGRWIPVLNELGDFSPGASLAPVPSPAGPLGVTICYESVFPHLVRRLAAQGAGLLVNLTNDAWYLDTDAPHQHFAANVFRALEAGAPLLRAANTGITAVIDARGRVQDRLGLFETGVLLADISPAAGRSLYARGGWIFPWLCLTAVVVAAAGRPQGRPLRTGDIRAV